MTVIVTTNDIIIFTDRHYRRSEIIIIAVIITDIIAMRIIMIIVIIMVISLRVQRSINQCPAMGGMRLLKSQHEAWEVLAAEPNKNQSNRSTVNFT